MIRIVAIALIAVVVAAYSAGSTDPAKDVEKQSKEFLKKYDKQYDEVEREKRFQVSTKNATRVAELSANETGSAEFSLSGPVADWDPEEFAADLLVKEGDLEGKSRHLRGRGFIGIPYGGYVRAAGGPAGCPDGDQVDSVEECHLAGYMVGNLFDVVVARAGGFAMPGGCFWAQNGGSYFNPNLESTASSHIVGAICREKASCTPVYLGCYKDDSSRDLKSYIGNGYTPQTCAAACSGLQVLCTGIATCISHKKYKYYALQYHGECFCDNDFSTPHGTYPKIADASCGSSEPRMGLGWTNAVYKCK